MAFAGAGDTSSGWLSRHGCRSEEHTSELQSQSNLVCRLLLEKKKTHQPNDVEEHHVTARAHCVDARSELVVGAYHVMSASQAYKPAASVHQLRPERCTICLQD